MDPQDLELSELNSEELIALVVRCAQELGWSVAIPQDLPDYEEVDGIVLGTDKFLKDIMGDVNLQENVDATRH